MKSEIGPKSIEPGLAPGGFVLRVYDGEGTMLVEQRFTSAAGFDEMMRLAGVAGFDDSVAGAVRVVYDGTTGERG